MKNVTMRDTGVPIIISYRRYLRAPKLKRERKFVGSIQFIKNLVAKALDVIEEAAFETKIEHTDPGQSVVANWAISVSDPFNPDPAGDRQQLVAYRLGKEIPKAGVTFDIITPAPKKKGPDHEERPDYGRDNDPVDISAEQLTALQRRREQQEILREGRSDPNSKFRPPPAPQYGPRKVRTIDEELADSQGQHEDTSHLDRSSSQREDN